MKNISTSLFIFRRDLRLEDNTGLIQALRSSKRVIPCFIFDPLYLKKNSPTYSEPRLNFLFDSLTDLSEDLKRKNSHLFLFFGSPQKIIEKIYQNFQFDAIFVNRDYTPASKNRDLHIGEFCKAKKIKFVSVDDLLLHDVDSIYTKEKKPYKVFTQFFNAAKKRRINNPQKNNFSNYYEKSFDFEANLRKIERSLNLKKNSQYQQGGRQSCKLILKNLKSYKNYEQSRNFPAEVGTTRLSSHNRFGTFSIREIYHNIAKDLGKNHPLITELHWRDFFTYVMYHYPYSFSKNFRSKYDKIVWGKNQKIFQKWCGGNTGFPIVDAGMRELNATGFMHNRVRMIVASFLTKDLHINWKWGERYFASKLIDYDPSVNVGNWQWAASTGCDSQPWFRIFNPWLQQEKFDPHCIYIKKWIPELEDLPPKKIHKWFLEKSSNIYPQPIVDHKEEATITKQMFQKISKKT